MKKEVIFSSLLLASNLSYSQTTEGRSMERTLDLLTHMDAAFKAMKVEGTKYYSNEVMAFDQKTGQDVKVKIVATVRKIDVLVEDYFRQGACENSHVLEIKALDVETEEEVSSKFISGKLEKKNGRSTFSEFFEVSDETTATDESSTTESCQSLICETGYELIPPPTEKVYQDYLKQSQELAQGRQCIAGEIKTRYSLTGKNMIVDLKSYQSGTYPEDRGEGGITYLPFLKFYENLFKEGDLFHAKKNEK